jgi:hypothetical protein
MTSRGANPADHRRTSASASIETALDPLVLGSVLARDGQEYCFVSQPFASALQAAPQAATLIERLPQ